jgi:hypothetical protein
LVNRYVTVATAKLTAPEMIVATTAMFTIVSLAWVLSIGGGPRRPSGLLLTVDLNHLGRLLAGERGAGHVRRLVQRVAVGVDVARGDTGCYAVAKERRDDDLGIAGVGGDAAEGRSQGVQVAAWPVDAGAAVEDAPYPVDADNGAPGFSPGLT